VIRTAEELGRAFPGKTVITSSGDQVKARVTSGKALVVATVGAEPIADGGYAAALLLDGDSLLRRETLRAGEDTVRRWFNAASLVRPGTENGLVVVTASDTGAVGALLRWDPAGYAQRELSLRAELQLPPAVRIASFTGPRAAVEHFSGAVAAQLEQSGVLLRTAGPAPVTLSGPPSARRSAEDVRTLVFFPYAQAAAVTRLLRATRAATAAKRTADPVQVRLDGVDVL
jgi:primosomal protein N' (replication factor Y)